MIKVTRKEKKKASKAKGKGKQGKDKMDEAKSEEQKGLNEDEHETTGTSHHNKNPVVPKEPRATLRNINFKVIFCMCLCLIHYGTYGHMGIKYVFCDFKKQKNIGTPREISGCGW